MEEFYFDIKLRDTINPKTYILEENFEWYQDYQPIQKIFQILKKAKQVEDFICKLKSEELFTNENFNLKAVLKTFDINEKEFKTYITTNYNLNVNDYLNNLHLNKFIELVKQENTEKYDITGLSRLAGFKSRATFYRVFKEKMGVTPKQYMESSK